MAKWNVTRECGHEEEIQIYGPGKDRESKAEYEATKLCGTCYQAKIQADRKAESEQAAEQSKATGLPALQGSDKQVAWAESVRAEYLAGVVKAEQLLAANFGARGAAEAAKALPEIRKQAESRTSAHEWIERRDRTAGADLRDAVRAMLS